MNTLSNRRILLIDDKPVTHRNFRKILDHKSPKIEADALETILLNEITPHRLPEFELDSAYQGPVGVAMVERALLLERPYALAFVDMRIALGWDGVQTIEQLWRHDPSVQIVVCTAYADYSWQKMLARLDIRDRLLIIKKPYDAIEVCQVAHALTEVCYGRAKRISHYMVQHPKDSANLDEMQARTALWDVLAHALTEVARNARTEML